MAFVTMREALAMSAEEIEMFHRGHGFPRDLTHHAGREAPRLMSHRGDYVDFSNRTGSILMYALLFEFGLHGRPLPQPVRV